MKDYKSDFKPVSTTRNTREFRNRSRATEYSKKSRVSGSAGGLLQKLQEKKEINLMEAGDISPCVIVVDS